MGPVQRRRPRGWGMRCEGLAVMGQTAAPHICLSVDIISQSTLLSLSYSGLGLHPFLGDKGARESNVRSQWRKGEDSMGR